MTDTRRASAMLAAVVDAQTDEVVLDFRDDSGSSFRVTLNPGIVSGLAVALFGLSSRLKNQDRTGIRTQFMSLTAAIPGVGPQGQPCLDLVLEQTIHFGVTFPKSAIPIFQSALAKLLEMSNEVKGPTRN